MITSMSKLNSLLIVAIAIFAMSSCVGKVEETTTQEAVVCCGGNCDAPAGTCCSDGTCGGNHDELPLAPKEQ
jgi:hypothetical protein